MYICGSVKVHHKLEMKRILVKHIIIASKNLPIISREHTYGYLKNKSHLHVYVIYFFLS